MKQVVGVRSTLREPVLRRRFGGGGKVCCTAHEGWTDSYGLR